MNLNLSMIVTEFPSFIMLIYFGVFEINQQMFILRLFYKSSFKGFFYNFTISKGIFTIQIQKCNEESKAEKDSSKDST